MNIKEPKGLLSLIIYTLVIVVFTFPFIATVIEPGLDPSYMWAFNHFFANGIQFGKDVVFAYGPFGFIKNPMPIGHNLEIAVVLISIIRLCFVFSTLLLCRLYRPGNDFFSFAIAYVLSICFNGMDYAIIGTVMATIFIYHESRNLVFLAGASLLAVFGLLIKINIGLTSGLILGSYVLIDWLYFKRSKSILLAVVFSILSLLVLWGIAYSKWDGLIYFIRNIFILSSGNLSATSLNTPNNWWLLGIGFTFFLSFPIIVRNKKIYLLYVISCLAFFGIFKYSFARQEELHMNQLLYFMLLLVFFSILLYSEIKPFHIIWLLVSLMLYNINMHLSKRYHLTDSVQIFGVNNFRTTVLNFSELKQKSKEKSMANLVPSKLPKSFLKKINGRSVDCYPWELSFIPANHLNYKPRPLFQLGCVNSTILNKENARFFESAEAPKFILWHQAWANERLLSIDERYLMNEDGLALFQILNHYEIVDSAKNIQLLQRTKEDRLQNPRPIGTGSYQWNEWIKTMPVDSSAFVIAKPIFRKSLLGKLKSILYKEKEYFIEYKLADGQIQRHRFVPDDAISGVWITPYLFTLSNSLEGVKVTEVRFITTDSMKMLENKISIQWMLVHKKQQLQRGL